MTVEPPKPSQAPPGSLYQRRIDAVRLHDEGVPVMQIVDRTGLGWAAVTTAIRLHHVGGAAALEPARRGPKPGTGRKLTADQEVEIQKLVRRRLPWYYALHDGLWSRGAVLRLIQQKLGITLTDHGLGNYLHRWGIEPKATHQPVAQIQTWLAQHLDKLRSMARREDAEIYWLHKTSRLDAAMWGSASARKVSAATPSAGQGRILASVSTSQGRLMWMILHQGAFNPDRQQKFLDALARRMTPRTLYLVRSDATTFRDDTLRAPPNLVVKLFPKFLDGRCTPAPDADVLIGKAASKGREGEERVHVESDKEEGASWS